MSSNSVQFDFQRSNVWQKPLMRTLVKNALNNRQVTIEGNIWKINGKPLITPHKHKLECVFCLFLNIFHGLKCLSPKYKKKYHQVLVHLNKIQLAKKQVIKTKQVRKSVAVQRANIKEQNLKESDAKFSKAEEKVAKLERKLTSLEDLYLEDNGKQSDELMDATNKQLLLHEYFNARNDLDEEDKKLRNKFYTSPELQQARAKVVNALAELKTVKDFHNTDFASLGIEQILKRRQVQENRVEEINKSLKQLTATYKEERDELQRLLNEAIVTKEALQVEFKKNWRTMHQSPIKLQKRLTPKPSGSDRLPGDLLTVTQVIQNYQKETNPPAKIISAPLPISPSQNYQKDTDLPAKAVSVPLPISSSSSLNKEATAFFTTLEKYCNKDLADLWNNLLNNFQPQHGSNFIQSFKKTKTAYELHLKRELKVWISSKNEEGKEDPLGGVIFLLGRKDSKIEFTLQKSKMTFKKGFEMFLMTPEWARNIPLIPTFLIAETKYIEFNDATNVAIAGRAWGKTKLRIKTIDELKQNWGKNAKVLPISKKDKQNENFILDIIESSKKTNHKQ